MRLRVGTSGFSYRAWKGEGRFYPADLPDRDMLSYYARHLDAVEINNTFYRMPSTKVLEGWAGQVPRTFRFVVKASRRITHLGRIGNVRDHVDYLVEKTSALGERLGPLLFQLPPFMRKDTERLEAFLAMLPRGVRAALEFRNVSWFDDEVFDLLRRRDVALCFADGEMKEDVPVVPTAGWGYLRLRRVAYEDDALREWVDTVRARPWEEAWVFFKHEEGGTGPKLATRFRELFGG